jgi:alkylated DNA repair dioxygenase AlkB
LFPPLDSKAKVPVPQGFRYLPEFLDNAEERALATALSGLDLKPFEFHGHVGNRRVVSFGLRYHYSRRGIERSDPPPPFLDDLRIEIANFASLEPAEFVQLGVNEYRPGAGIGWHRDKSEFGDVVGVSLLHPAKMRFRKRKGDGWVRTSHILEPRSVYLLTGEARQVWEHSIPPLESLRYSLIFRTLVPGAPILLSSD